MPTEKRSKHGRKRIEHDNDDDDYEIDEDDNDEMEAELALRPGEVLRVPLVGKSCEVRIKFIGFGQRKRHGRRRENVVEPLAKTALSRPQ